MAVLLSINSKYRHASYTSFSEGYQTWLRTAKRQPQREDIPWQQNIKTFSQVSPTDNIPKLQYITLIRYTLPGTQIPIVEYGAHFFSRNIQDDRNRSGVFLCHAIVFKQSEFKNFFAIAELNRLLENFYLEISYSIKETSSKDIFGAMQDIISEHVRLTDYQSIVQNFVNKLDELVDDQQNDKTKSDRKISAKLGAQLASKLKENNSIYESVSQEEEDSYLNAMPNVFELITKTNVYVSNYSHKPNLPANENWLTIMLTRQSVACQEKSQTKDIILSQQQEETAKPALVAKRRKIHWPQKLAIWQGIERLFLLVLAGIWRFIFPFFLGVRQLIKAYYVLMFYLLVPAIGLEFIAARLKIELPDLLSGLIAVSGIILYFHFDNQQRDV